MRSASQHRSEVVIAPESEHRFAHARYVPFIAQKTSNSVDNYIRNAGMASRHHGQTRSHGFKNTDGSSLVIVARGCQRVLNEHTGTRHPMRDLGVGEGAEHPDAFLQTQLIDFVTTRGLDRAGTDHDELRAWQFSPHGVERTNREDGSLLLNETTDS